MIDQIGQGRNIILRHPLNANLEKLLSLVTKTIGHPLQLNQSNFLIQVTGEKPHGKKSPALNK